MDLQISEFFPKETQYWNCCKIKKGYAGTAIFVSDKFGGSKPSQVTYDIGIKKHDEEGRVVTAEFDSFILVVSYVPNAGVQGLNRLNYRVKEWD